MSKFSIILPVRNGGEYVKECVNSILSQTCTGFNLLVLDNCSSDGTVDWIRSLKDDRVILHTAKYPLNIEKSWQRIVRIKKNEFITLIGHDDLLDNNYLEVINLLINKNPQASLYQTHFRLINEIGNKIRTCKPMPEIETPGDFLQSILQQTTDIFGTGYMMRAKDYDEIGGIPPYPNLLFADFELWLNLTCKSYKAIAKEECFSYRLHESTTKISSNLRMLRAFEKFMLYLSTLRNNPDFRNIIDQNSLSFLKFYRKSLSHRLLKAKISSREGLTVKAIVDKFDSFARGLTSESGFHLEQDKNIRLALLIDDYSLLKQMFLLFKKIYTKSIVR